MLSDRMDARRTLHVLIAPPLDNSVVTSARRRYTGQSRIATETEGVETHSEIGE